MDHDDADEPTQSAALPPLEAALLWSMRAWAIGLSRGLRTEAEIAALYGELGVPGAAFVLDRFMLALNRGAQRMIDVNCVCHPGLSQDELDLVDVLALQQEGRAEDATAVLRRLATPREAAQAAQAAAELVRMLNREGHWLPRASAALRRHGFAAQFAWSGSAPSTCLH